MKTFYKGSGMPWLEGAGLVFKELGTDFVSFWLDTPYSNLTIKDTRKASVFAYSRLNDDSTMDELIAYRDNVFMLPCSFSVQGNDKVQSEIIDDVLVIGNEYSFDGSTDGYPVEVVLEETDETPDDWLYMGITKSDNLISKWLGFVITRFTSEDPDGEVGTVTLFHEDDMMAGS